MKKERNIAVTLFRNGKSIFKRLVLAIHHRNEGEILYAIINIIEESVWLTCVLIFFACLVIGFWKPHCFITAVFYLIVTGLIRTNIEDRKKGGMFTASEEE